MELLKVLSFCVLLQFILVTKMKSQDNFVSAGSNKSGIGGTVSFSFGQTYYHTYYGSEGSIAEGVHQPIEISILSGTTIFPFMGFTCFVFPNPCKDYLIFKMNGNHKDELIFRLFDNSGLLLRSNRLTGAESRIEMNQLAAGIYFLQIIYQNKLVQIFKIAKN